MDCAIRSQEKKRTTTLLTLALLLLVATTVVTTTPAQATPSTRKQNSSHCNATKQSPPTTGTYYWAETYGGSRYDVAQSVEQTSDGGYIVSGCTDSFGAGGLDVWVLKLDSAGSVEWEKTYGGIRWDLAYSVQQTSDGGYIVAGETGSFSAGGSDVWVLKLGNDGSVIWQKTYGHTSWDCAYSVRQTSDGGYIVAGLANSFGAGDIYWTQYNDVWVLKLNSSGSVEWQKTYEGNYYDEARSIQQTSDGGYIVAGYTESFGEGYRDFWVLKLGNDGSIEWQKTYGGSSGDEAYSVRQTTDGRYIVAGYTHSFGAGSRDFWVLNLDSSGSVVWQNTYGGDDYDGAQSIQQTSDGGYIVAGQTDSFYAGSIDFWVLKLNSGGSVTWQKTYGGSGRDVACSVQQTSDGGYIVSGYTDSFGAGSFDVWLVKLGAGGDIFWNANSGASTNATRVTPLDSSAMTSTTSAIPANSTAIVGDTEATVRDTHAAVEEQARGSPISEFSSVVIVLVGVGVVATVVTIAVIANARSSRKSRR